MPLGINDEAIEEGRVSKREEVDDPDEETRADGDAALAFVWEEVEKLMAAAQQEGAS